MAGRIRVGIGGWTFAPWRGTFYPEKLAHSRELAFASRAMTSIEINGTYYSTFKPGSFKSWYDDTPDGFMFSVKASRYCTNRRVLAEAGPSIERFFGQGLGELKEKLGPINWQFMPRKAFDQEDFGAFLKLLPSKIGRLPLRHALEVRHPSFKMPAFYELAAKYGAAIVYAEGEDVPVIDEACAGFTYARIMTAREDAAAGLNTKEFSALARRLKKWAEHGDVFCYFISGAKVRNPAAALALIKKLA